MVRILFYGDSNTWGYIPGTNYQRYSKSERFTGLIQSTLGSNFDIIEEGLNSRTLISEDKRKGKEGRNGSAYLIPCLDSHDPIDIVVLMLGTNQTKKFYDNTPEEIANQLDDFFVKVILNRKSQFKDSYPKLIIISPPLVDETTEWAKDAYEGAHEKSMALGKLYQELSNKNNCFYISAEDMPTGSDGVHLTKEGHELLSRKVVAKIKEVI